MRLKQATLVFIIKSPAQTLGAHTYHSNISKNYSSRPERPVHQTLVTRQTLTATQEVTSVGRSVVTPSLHLRHVLAPSWCPSPASSTS